MDNDLQRNSMFDKAFTVCCCHALAREPLQHVEQTMLAYMLHWCLHADSGSILEDQRTQEHSRAGPPPPRRSPFPLPAHHLLARHALLATSHSQGICSGSLSA